VVVVSGSVVVVVGGGSVVGGSVIGGGGFVVVVGGGSVVGGKTKRGGGVDAGSVVVVVGGFKFGATASGATMIGCSPAASSWSIDVVICACHRARSPASASRALWLRSSCSFKVSSCFETLTFCVNLRRRLRLAVIFCHEQRTEKGNKSEGGKHRPHGLPGDVL
jgi:hypothetical protein